MIIGLGLVQAFTVIIYAKGLDMSRNGVQAA
jgi:hypothetical protein